MKRPRLQIVHPEQGNYQEFVRSIPTSNLEAMGGVPYLDKLLAQYYSFVGSYDWEKDNVLVGRRPKTTSESIATARLVLPVNNWFVFEKMTTDDGFNHFYFRAHVGVEYEGKTFPAEVNRKNKRWAKTIIEGVQMVQPHCPDCSKPQDDYELVRDPIEYLAD